MNPAKITVCFIFSSFLFGCATNTKRELIPAQNEIAEKGLFSVSAEWLKEKGNRVDVMMHLKNQSDQFLVIPYSDLVCTRGGEEGEVSFPAGFMSNNREQVRAIIENEVDLVPDQNAKRLLSCRFAGGGKGSFSIKIKNVYKRVAENGNGVALVHVAGNLVWQAEKP